MTTYTCAVTGEESGGKHYIVRTTEGEELLSPEALLGTKAKEKEGAVLRDLRERIERLEELLLDRVEEGQADEEHAAAAAETPIAQAAKKAAAPVKKAASRKAPAQRKAVD